MGSLFLTLPSPSPRTVSPAGRGGCHLLAITPHHPAQPAGLPTIVVL